MSVDSLGFPWEGRAIGLLDLDAFFASVEQLDHPKWRGKPVIVGGDANRRGVVSTASYEARRFGVHSAMPSAQARRLCPNAIWVHGNYARYRELSDAVMGIIVDETPRVEQVSIDEAFFDVTPGHYSRESPIAICRRIQMRVAELGVTCSIGLGTSKTVAKIASEREKPRGLTVVPPGTERSFLAPLSVRAMSGIGPAAEKRLGELGIRTLGQLAERDPADMERLLGSYGPHLVERAAGLENSPVRYRDAPEEVKSVSNERTFAHDLTTAAEVRAAVRHVSELVGARLRKKGLAGTEVTLKIRFDWSHTRTVQRQLPRPTDDEHVFGNVALELLDEVWVEGMGVRLVGVAVSGFDRQVVEQLSLFGTDAEAQATNGGARDLAVTLDALRERFGQGAVEYGHDLRLTSGDEYDRALDPGR